MIGTVVNTIAVILGALLGYIIKGRLKQRYRDILTSVLGLAVIFTGASSALGGMLSDGAEPILYIVSLVIGCIIGEFLDIEGKLCYIGDLIQKKIGSNGGNISQGFVTASLTFCIGTMAIMGSIESGIMGVHTILYTKSVIDGVTSIVYASTLGIGVVFSAVSVFLYEGMLTITASLLQPYITNDMMREVSIVGGILIAAIGVNMLEIKKFKVGNMLPAIIVPVIYYLPFVRNIVSAISTFLH
ncbi:MAG: DUF554 domain-containing protein [Clostridia bacterium]|nr:DUF554 domain-containing protein [Clostridia bacterium]MCI1998957.1 DUF554 domain-containing protein [Clostridia bacterium]MCI2013707.1 DUF554 domain-containing protein [Clostridia bacterium]